MKYYYRRLRDLREDNDLNQEDIAKILQTTQQQYYRYEKGERELPIHHLITLAKFYKVSTDYILELSEDPNNLVKNNIKLNQIGHKNNANFY